MSLRVVSYQLTANSMVTLQVSDCMGREVMKLFNGMQAKGEYKKSTDGCGWIEERDLCCEGRVGLWSGN